MESVKRIALSKEGNQYYIRNITQDYHTKEGYIRKEDLKKKAAIAKTNTGSELFIFEPGFIDSYRKIKRLPQIIPLKDIGAIIAVTGISPKSKVVDAGSGSGALALFLAHLVKEVTTYEIRDDFIAVVRENIAALGIKNIKVKKKDVTQGIDEKNVDLVVLDMPNPWDALPAVQKSLKVGGFLVSYSPTIVQAADVVHALKDHKSLLHIKTTETLEREWEIDERRIRPHSQMLAHSGFLTFIRKVSE
ncbi:methyltransferase domain-containing protein [Candidatus Woesearchaeota archaeon]|nr:methyltransferase domain-containing protein [Candidatus Woesearchaeota archaeon]